jgi:hypothetical protein
LTLIFNYVKNIAYWNHMFPGSSVGIRTLS